MESESRTGIVERIMNLESEDQDSFKLCSLLHLCGFCG